MTRERDAEELQIMFTVAEWLESGEGERARALYDWLAEQLNKHDAEHGNVRFLNAKERTGKVKP